MVSVENYQKQANELEKDALQLRGTDEDWQYLKSQDGISIYYRQSPHFNGNAYKFIGEMNAPCDAIYDVMKPPATTAEKLKWDKSIFHYERLKCITPELFIGLMVTHSAAMGMISKREFVDLYYFKVDESDISNEDYGRTCWIFAKSVDIEYKSVEKKIVRGRNYPAGYAVAKNKKDPQKSYLELYVNCDVGGMIPRSLVESALPKQQVNYFQSVRKEVFKRLGK